MCGIVGLIAKSNNGLISQHESCFSEMLYADAVRGFDSTGVIGVTHLGDFGIMKEATEAAMFIPKLRDSTLWKEMYSRGKVWIGHNRKKTIGDIADNTAHPFVVGNTFAMVHNGTLNAWKSMKEGALTDSEALTHVLKKAFDQENWKEALEEELGKVWGAYALAMFDQKRMLVHLLRNKERPLSRIEADNAYYFCSEPAMGLWVLGRNGYSLDKLKVTVLDEHVLHTYDLNKGYWTEEKLSPKKYTVVQSTPTASTTKHHGKSNGGECIINLDEKQLSRIKKKLLGKRVVFWADDYFEQRLPLTIEEGETELGLFGESEDIKWRHQLYCEVNLKHFDLSTEEDVFGNKWSGLVDDVCMSHSKDRLWITLTGVIPMPKSVSNRDKVKQSIFNKSLVELRNDLDTKGWNMLDWIKDIYREAIKEREAQVAMYEDMLNKDKDITTQTRDVLMENRRKAMGAALEAAKSKGVEIGFKVVGNNHVWFNRKDPSEIIYESPVAIFH
jgi:hypothetical protein